MGRLFTTILILLSALAAPVTVRAQDGGDRIAAARALFAEGRTLAGLGRYADAAAKFEASVALERGIGTLFNLADCYEHMGYSASAWTLFNEVAATARDSGQHPRERVAEARAQRLAPKLVQLTIELATSARVEGLKVRLDGNLVEPDALRRTLPLDPGLHRIEANAPGRAPFREQVYADPTIAREVTVTVALLLPSIQLTEEERAREAVEPKPRSLAQRYLGIGMLSAGAATLGVGALLGLRAKKTYDGTEQHCDSTGCDAQGLAATRRALHQGNAATAVSIAGAVVLAAGAVTYWLDRRARKRERPHVQLSAQGVGGRW